MKLQFTKMQGLGNDFVVIDGVRQPVRLSAAQLRWLADRHFGVGCDQTLLVEAARAEENDFRYRIFNADGGEVEQCGNGARCFARFVADQGLSDKQTLRVETKRGVIVPQLTADGQVTVDMGQPRFRPQDIPFLAAGEAVIHTLDVGGRELDITVVSMGNPHAVQHVANVDTAPVAVQGPLIEAHPCFPEHVNAGFMQVVERNLIRLRVYERGSGETLACGTGACAAVVAGIRRGILDATVRVVTLGGELTIHWGGVGQSVFMSGPAITVFTGVVEIPEFDYAEATID